jgi:uncharacterized membrane protein YoaK (UPF0700 family)
MTGNTSQLSSEVSSTDLSDIIFFGSIILSFVAGAILARLIVIWGIIHNVRLVFCQILFVEGILLTGVSLRDVFPCAHQQPRDYYFPVLSDGHS